MYRPTPAFIVALVALALIGITVLIIIKAHNYAIDMQAEQALSKTRIWPPEINCAYPGQPTWDCIRHIKPEKRYETAHNR